MSTNRIKLPLFDDYWVDARPGTRRRWFAPELICLPPTTLGYASMFYDPTVGKYRLYYETITDMSHDDDRVLKLLETEDMVHFTQITTDNGSDVIVDYCGHVHGAAVLYDPHDPAPERRYKRCGMYGEKRGEQWLCPSFSADGIHWQDRPDIVIHRHYSDAGNHVFYNPCFDEYCLVLRSSWGDRRIVLKTSRDFEHWSEPRTVLHPDALYHDELIRMEHYSMPAHWFDGIFYGLLWQFGTDMRSVPGRHGMNSGDVSEPELVYSYDGREFLHTNGKPLMERPLAPIPGWAGLAPTDICESADGQYYYLLCLGYSFIHGSPESNKKLNQIQQARGNSSGHVIYRIRKDSFCGIESVSGGALYTGPIELLADDLTLNLRAECGSVRIGVINSKGEFLKGFSLEDAIPLEYISDVAITPQWREHSLKELIGKRIRLAIDLNGAILHSISATARPHVLQPQHSFYDPQGI